MTHGRSAAGPAGSVLAPTKFSSLALGHDGMLMMTVVVPGSSCSVAIFYFFNNIKNKYTKDLYYNLLNLKDSAGTCFVSL